MPYLTFAALRTQIAKGALQPIYVFEGEDDVGKAEAIDWLVESVDEDLRVFNVDRLDASGATNAAAREALTSQLLVAARTLPMMAPRRVVILQRADMLLFARGKKDDEDVSPPENPEPAQRPRKGATAADPIEAYVESPEASTTLVFVAESLPQNRRIGKLLSAEAAVVAFGADVSEPDAVQWIEDQARAARMGIDAAAIRALLARTGPNGVRLRSAVERVLLYAMDHGKVTVEDVRQAVPVAPDSPENFGIANAIRRNDAAGALRELHLALEAGGAPFFLLGQLRSAAEGFPSSRLRDAIDAVFRTDVALKSSGGDPQVLLERLVVELTRSNR